MRTSAITLSAVSLAAPDGRALFHDIDLTFERERTGLVGRNGVGKTSLLRLIAGEMRPAAGHVRAEGRIAMLRQSSEPAGDATIADLFGAREALAVLRRAEEGRATLEELGEVDWTLEARMAEALARTGLDAPPQVPLSTLSGGQATRAALAALVFAEPDFLLLDEPTNNLDRDGRRAVTELLAGWKAGAVVVSHDRELLDTMDAIVELTSLGAGRYGGNWSRYRELKALELEAARRELADAEKRASELARKAQETAERQARRDGAGRRKAKGGGTPRILLGGMKERSENTGANQTRIAERRRGEALAAVGEARERLEVLQPLSVTLPSTGLPAGRAVLRVERVTAGHEPGQPVLNNLSLSITGPERIAVAGPNGSGKSTLLALVTGVLQPWQGSVSLSTRAAMLDQRVGVLERDASIRDNFIRLNPGASENACRAALARFRFRADAAMQAVATLSGGQLLRAGLSCVLGGEDLPSLLILDEPTNYLDMESVEAVEAGLAAYDGALLLVSHDERFLEACGVTRRLELPSGEMRDV